MHTGLSILVIVLQLLLPPGVCFCHWHAPDEAAGEHDPDSGIPAAENAHEDAGIPDSCPDHSSSPAHAARVLESAQAWRARAGETREQPGALARDYPAGLTERPLPANDLHDNNSTFSGQEVPLFVLHCALTL